MQILHALAKALVLQLAGPASRTATGNGTAIDVGEYEGSVAVVLNSTAGSGTSPTLDFSLEESDTSGGTYTAVPDTAYAEGAFAQVTNAAASLQVRHLNISDRKQFIRAKWTIGGTTPSFVLSAELLGQKKYQ